MLVRTERKASRQEQWLLFRKSDEHSVAGWDTEQFPLSVKSGLTNDDIQNLHATKPDSSRT